MDPAAGSMVTGRPEFGDAKSHESPAWRRCCCCCAVYVLFILDLAWLQFPSHYPAPNVVPLRSIIDDWKTGGREWIVNFLGNIVAFIPIGMIPRWPGRDARAPGMRPCSACPSVR